MSLKSAAIDPVMKILKHLIPGLALAVSLPLSAGEPPELVVHDRQEALECLAAPAARVEQQPGDVVLGWFVHFF